MGEIMRMYLCIYLVLINIAAVVVYGVDKHREKVDAKRLPKALLWVPAVAGGTTGTLRAVTVLR